MSVPEEIRKVERPKNTVVIDTGNATVYRYAVRERRGVTYVSGGNPQPMNGKIIGHIIEGKYVSLEEKAATKGPDALSYGSSKLIKDLSEDVVNDLLNVYELSDALRIFVIAAIRIIKPGIVAGRIANRYSRTFFSHWYPNLALSENTVGTLFEKIGEDGRKREKFYELRMKAIGEDDHIAIDGTLKQDTSIVNDLSSYSHKARIKGCKDLSVLYAYDIEKREPICAEVFRGNFIDGTSFSAFINHNHIYKGIVVADKGFPPSKIANDLKEHPDLHFLIPLKRSDSRIKSNDMLSWEGALTGVTKRILYKKNQIKGGRFLYSYKDMSKAHGEENGFFDKNKDKFSIDDFNETLEKSGLIVFESDLDAEPLTIYQCYERRWLLELVFRHYKSDECLDRTRQQGDFSLIGSEFVNFIATLISTRIVNKFENTELLKKLSYSDLMEDLTDSWRKVDAPDPASSDDKYWKNVSEGVFPELEALGLSIPAKKPEPKKRGRKRTKPLPDPSASKKKRGRPRKNPVSETL